MTAAMIPPAIASAAVSAGRPPVSWAMAMAIGVVTAFGAIESATALLPPSSHTAQTPVNVEVNDPAKFMQDPRQVMAHEATHILQNNLPGPLQSRIPADTTTGDPYNIDNVDSLRKMGKTLFDLPREQGASVVQRYVANQDNPAERARLQPWMDDMKTAPLSITMPTAPDAKRMNMAPRPPGLPQNIPEAMLQPRRKALQ